jgi:hypothetical protein
MSQISIVQPSKKRQRPTNTTTTLVDVFPPKDNSNKSRPNIKATYLNTPDHIFKTMLTMELEGAENCIQALDTPEKLQYTRIYAQLVNDLFYLRLKQDFWENYYRVAMTTRIWLLTLSKQILKETNLHRIQFRTQESVEKRRQTAIEELKQTENKLYEHKQLEMSRLVEMNRLSTVIPAFVRKGQHKLSADFERRKVLLQLDANDYSLVQTFYDLQPSEDQVRKFTDKSSFSLNILTFKLLQRKLSGKLQLTNNKRKNI